MDRSAASRRVTSIQAYRSKHDFTATSEPAPNRIRHKPRVPFFVVQKHEANRPGLHWDFRIEHNGTLWSWAIQKGPSLDPADKRIAIHVEDHLLDDADFQGSIADDNYGAGAVESGTWVPGTADRPRPGCA